jgi:hypothetical protein
MIMNGRERVRLETSTYQRETTFIGIQRPGLPPVVEIMYVKVDQRGSGLVSVKGIVS